MKTSLSTLLGIVAAGGLAAQGFAQAPAPPAQNDAGRRSFELRCGRCHGGDGKGGEMGPDITARLAGFRADDQLTNLIHTGLPASGMPPNAVQGQELADLMRFVHSIEARPAGGGRGGFGRQPRVTVETTTGQTLSGAQLGEGFDDMQVRTDDGRIHLLRRAGAKYREVTSEIDWPGYNGDPRGNRYTTMTQITKANVTRLAARWVFAYPAAGGGRGAPAAPPTRLEMTPVVAGGLMYVSNVNECIALDAGSGRQVWRFMRPRTAGMMQDAGVNRGVAVAGDKVFLETDNAHIVAINHLRPADCGRSRDHGRGGRRTRRQRLGGGLRSGYRQGGVAFQRDPEARRAGLGNLEGQGTRSWRRADVVHRQLRSRSRYCLLADGQPRRGVQRRRPPRR
jgi:alcohol dehydrogenase (cytochrome c)